MLVGKNKCTLHNSFLLKLKQNKMTIQTGNWNEQKSKLKKQFPELTDKDIFFVFGKKNDMLATLPVKLGKTNEEFLKIIETL
jgi:hypothetical protein